MESRRSLRPKRFVTFGFAAVLFAFLGIILWLPGIAGKDTHSVSVKVMSYNIRVGAGGGAERLPAEKGLEKVAKVVERYKPDLLLAQEIEKGARRSQGVDEINWLMRRLDYPHVSFAPAIIDATWNYGVAIFSRYPVKVSSQRYLLFKPDYSESHPEYPGFYSEQRVLLRATMAIEGTTTSVFCTHLGLTQDQRERQVKEILQHLAKEKPPIIIGGDFNAKPDAAELEPLRSELRDVFDVLSVPLEERLSFPAGKASRGAIDTLFVSSEIEVVQAFVVRDESLASDHNPVYAELRIPIP